MTYFSVVLFGKEAKGSGLHHPETFQAVTASLTRLLASTGQDLRVRGFVEGERGRNVAPRRGKPTPALTERYIEKMSSDRFVNWELFDDSWSNTKPPDLYVNLTKLWHYDAASGYTPRTVHGAENCVTLAVADDAVPQVQLVEAARGLFEPLGVFYGFVEPTVGWDRPRTAAGVGACFGELMDTRWHELIGAYVEKDRMDALVPGIFRGNVLSAAHLRQGVEGVRAVADRVETWGGLTYVEFDRDPQFDRSTFDSCIPYFNAVPPSRMWRLWDVKGWSP